jgi:DNA-directed RNA polymerase subunit alpha
MNRSVKELELSIRSENCLMRGGIRTVADLARCTREDLLKIRNLGKVSLVEIVEKLESAGLHLKSSNKEKEEY